jgi:hypothetical protein
MKSGDQAGFDIFASGSHSDKPQLLTSRKNRPQEDSYIVHCSLTSLHFKLNSRGLAEDGLNKDTPISHGSRCRIGDWAQYEDCVQWSVTCKIIRPGQGCKRSLRCANCRQCDMRTWGQLFTFLHELQSFYIALTSREFLLVPRLFNVDGIRLQ